MGHADSSTRQALGGLPHQAVMIGVMSLIGSSRPTAVRQFFGRYWGYSGHREAPAPEGSVVCDPSRS
jgi:hypothetical protein